MKRKHQADTMDDSATLMLDTFSDNEEQPLVLMEMQCSYRHLVWSIEQLPFCQQALSSSSSSSSTCALPLEIIHRIAQFLTLQPVVSSQVVAVRATSTDGRHDLQECLDTSQSSWWLSAFGSMPRGRGEEYVEFQLSPSKLCRVSSISIEIPPFPLGPLSVRTMRLDAKVYDDGTTSIWKQVSSIWTVENRTGWQQYHVEPPIDAQFVRVVCLTNQMAEVIPGSEQTLDNQFSAVGFYCVKFE